MKKILLLGILSPLIIFAYNNNYKSDAQQKNSTRKGNPIGTILPQESSGKPRTVIRDRLESTTVERRSNYKEQQIRKTQRQLVLTEIFDTDILMQPVTRVIRSIDVLGITPEYITTVLFPSNMKIMEGQASFKTSLFEKKNNLLRFRPDRDTFASGNIVLTLSDGTKNYEMTLIVNRYYQKDCHIDNNEYICKKIRKQWSESKSSKSYAYAYNNLSIYYKYINAQILDSLDVISTYEKLKGKNLSLNTDGDYDVFIYKGVSYRIIRDDKHGDIYYRAYKYRIKVGA